MGWWKDQQQAWIKDWGRIYERLKSLLGFLKWVLGFTARLSAYAALFCILYLYWPATDIFGQPLASLTLRDILHTLSFIVLAVLLVRALFNPIDGPGVHAAWRWFGLFLIAGAIATGIYITR